MKFPEGLLTKRIHCGPYTTATGRAVAGRITARFEKPMLHLPTGDVITASRDIHPLDEGEAEFFVPVTVTDDLITIPDGRKNQRLLIGVDIVGYKVAAHYVDIHPDDPDVIDFDQIIPYPDDGSIPVGRHGVSSVAGLTGAISAQQLADIVGPMVPVTISEETRLQIVSDAVDNVQEALTPEVDLVVLFENSLA